MLRKIPQQIIRGGINPCGKHVCLCIEYLDFGEKGDMEKYKHCYDAYEKNSRYEKKKKTLSYGVVLANYMKYR
jgi:hypothetical protein